MASSASGHVQTRSPRQGGDLRCAGARPASDRGAPRWFDGLSTPRVARSDSSGRRLRRESSSERGQLHILRNRRSHRGRPRLPARACSAARRPIRSSISLPRPSTTSKPGSASSASGHFEAAKREFDKAVSILLESPYGGRTEPRIREHFDRLVDRISAYEVQALAEGDGFTEKKYEPASIDELLAMSATLGAADRDRRDRRTPFRADPRRARHADSAQPAGARLHRAVPGPAARLHRRRDEARQQVPADDPERLPGRRPAAGSGLHPAGRERVQAERAVARQGQGRLAVHARNGDRERPAPGLVHRRAVRPGKGHGRRGQVSRARWPGCSTATGTSRWRRTTAARDGCSAP